MRTLPDLAVEGGLGVDLGLVDVELAVEQLLHRPQQPRVPRQLAEHV